MKLNSLRKYFLVPTIDLLAGLFMGFGFGGFFAISTVSENQPPKSRVVFHGILFFCIIIGSVIKGIYQIRNRQK